MRDTEQMKTFQSLPGAADPFTFRVSQTVTSQGSAAFDGLQEERSMSPAPDTRGSDATSDNANIIGPNDRYVASGPQAVVPPPLDVWIESPLIICSWCSFQVRAGRGSLVRVDRCHLCEMEGTND